MSFNTKANNMMYSLKSYVGIYVLLLTGTHTFRILISPQLTTKIGNTTVELVCYIDKSDNENVLSPVITIEIYNITLQTFDPIVIFPFKDDPLLTPAGQYLQNRVTISASNATISFHEITCEDEKNYICKVAYTDGSGYTHQQYSEITSINITSPSQKPFAITSSSIFNDLHEYQNVTFVCRGNVGNPPENLKWIHYRNDSLFQVYYDVLTSTTRNTDNCTNFGISELNLTISLHDDKAVIGCAVNSSYDLGDDILKTTAFNVFYSVRDIVVARSPNEDFYEEDINKYLNMSCYANGNPSSNYAWHNWERRMQKNTSFLALQMTVDNSGIYQCTAFNTFHNETYNVSTAVNITIVGHGNTDSPVTETKRDFLPALSVCFIGVVVLLVAVFCYRRRKKKLVKRNSDSEILHTRSLNHNTDGNADDIQLAGTYASVKDASRIKEQSKPKASEYADILEVSNRKKKSQNRRCGATNENGSIYRYESVPKE